MYIRQKVLKAICAQIGNAKSWVHYKCVVTV